MVVIGRIIGLSLLAGWLAAILPFVIWKEASDVDHSLLSLILGCVGAIVGAVAGATGEIVRSQGRAQRADQKERAEWGSPWKAILIPAVLVGVLAATTVAIRSRLSEARRPQVASQDPVRLPVGSK